MESTSTSTSSSTIITSPTVIDPPMANPASNASSVPVVTPPSSYHDFTAQQHQQHQHQHRQQQHQHQQHQQYQQHQQHQTQTQTAPSLMSSTSSSIATTTTKTTTTTAAPQSQLNPRSCVTCRRRKVRCNKRDPCSNCNKAGIECIFPGPGRAPRKPKRSPDAELLARLRRLEGVVESLGGAPPVSNVEQHPRDHTGSPNGLQDEHGERDLWADCIDADPKKIRPRGQLYEELGRLAVDKERSRYVSNRLWASLGDQIEEVRDMLDPTSSEDEDYPSPESSYSGSHDGFLFGHHSVARTLRNCHPTPTQSIILWKIYQENVAPLVTILHRPTIQVLMEAAVNLDPMDRSSEALVFSVYLAAIISMTPEQCLSLLGEDRRAAVQRYRFAMEQALAQANLFSSQSLTLLQAAVLFLTSVRSDDDTRFAWSMTGLVLRIAQGLGLHRDGSNFGLKPFEAEMRRRLWWHICLLDVQSSEVHGTDPMIHEFFYDTHLPLNINDNDFGPDSIELPSERVGCTDMTPSLLRFEITLAYRRLTFVAPNCPRKDHRSIEEHENLVETLNRRLEERYIQYCDMTVPVQWVCATIARLVIAKLWLIVHHPMVTGAASLSHETRNRVFLTSIEVIEFSRLLQTNMHTAKWSWLFRTYSQWHAVAFVLAELCVRPLCPIVDRAWAAVRGVYKLWELEVTLRKGIFWRPLARLMKRASEFRRKQEEERQPPLESDRPALPPSSSAASGPNWKIGDVFNPSQLPPNLIINGSDTDLQKGLSEVYSDIFSGNWLVDSSPSSSAFGVDPEPITSGNAYGVADDPIGSTNPFDVHIPFAAKDWDHMMREF